MMLRPVAVPPVKETARVMMTYQRVARRSAIALHHVEHARRNARLQRQLAQTVSGQRGEFRHLQHRGIP